MAVSSFAAYGTKFSTHSSPFFDGVLGLWARARTGPSIVQETWYPDQTSFAPVGKLNYAVNDVTFTLSGPFSIDSGEFSGLTGTYTQTAQPGGSSGSVNFLNADGTTVVSEFDTKNGGTKFAAGNSSISLSKLSGYSLTESIAYLNTGTSTATAIDSNGISSTLSFKPDLSGTGKVYGNLPGLPAELSWDNTGAGKVLFVDRSVAQLVDWKVATQTPAERRAFSAKIEQPNTRR